MKGETSPTLLWAPSIYLKKSGSVLDHSHSQQHNLSHPFLSAKALEIQKDLGLLEKETCSARGKVSLSHPVPDFSPLQVQHFLRKIISRINKEEESEAPITSLFKSLGSLAEPCFMPFSLPAVPLPCPCSPQDPGAHHCYLPVVPNTRVAATTPVSSFQIQHRAGHIQASCLPGQAGLGVGRNSNCATAPG